MRRITETLLVTFNHNLTGIGGFVGFGVTGCLVGWGCEDNRIKRSTSNVGCYSTKLHLKIIAIAKNLDTHGRNDGRPCWRTSGSRSGANIFEVLVVFNRVLVCSDLRKFCR
jgi:hypothetical protein